MKLNFLLLFLLIFLSEKLQAQSLSQFKQGDSIVAGIGCGQGFSEAYRFKPKDINSYKQLGKDYGKDTFQVYFKGKLLPHIQPDKATLFYAKDTTSKNEWDRYYDLFITDGNTIYYDDVLMQGADAQNIYYVADQRISLFRSNNNIYFKGYLLDKLNPDNIAVIDPHPNEETNYFTDGKNVYQNEIWVENADAKTFKRNGYVIRNRSNGNYENVADSRDYKNFYLNGKKVKIYPNWTETKLFPDSIYSKQYLVTFISAYQTQDVKAIPVIDFYLSDKDFEQLTKNKILKRKTEFFLGKEPFLNQVKGYKIQVYKNKNLEETYYYEEDLEEWDIKTFTQINIVGDGFNFSKSDFNELRKRGMPINYSGQAFENYESRQQKIAELSSNNNVIYYEPSSYYLSPPNNENKRYKRTIYEYWLDSNNTKRSQLATYEGLFTFKIERESATKILNDDIGDFNTEERQAKKTELIENLLGKGAFFVHTNDDIFYANGKEWLTFDVYCSAEYMKNVPKENIQYNWQRIVHLINWAEK